MLPQLSLKCLSVVINGPPVLPHVISYVVVVLTVLPNVVTLLPNLNGSTSAVLVLLTVVLRVITLEVFTGVPPVALVPVIKVVIEDRIASILHAWASAKPLVLVYREAL